MDGLPAAEVVHLIHEVAYELVAIVGVVGGSFALSYTQPMFHRDGDVNLLSRVVNSFDYPPPPGRLFTSPQIYAP